MVQNKETPWQNNLNLLYIYQALYLQIQLLIKIKLQISKNVSEIF